MRPACEVANHASRRLATLSLDQRRRSIFGNSSVETATKLAVPHAIQEIDQQADHQPHQKSYPSEHWQAKHKRKTQDDAHNRKNWHEWDTKRPRTRWVGPTQNGHTDTNQNESEQGSNVRQIGKRPDVR